MRVRAVTIRDRCGRTCGCEYQRDGDLCPEGETTAERTYTTEATEQQMLAAADREAHR